MSYGHRAHQWNKCAEIVRQGRVDSLVLSIREKQITTLRIQECIARAAFPGTWRDAAQALWQTDVEPGLSKVS